MNFQENGDDGPYGVDHPEYTGGVIRLDRWQNFGTASWGSGHGLNATATDSAGEHTISLSADKTNGRHPDGNYILTNTDLLISKGRLLIRDDDGLTISGIPEAYRTGGYDLYLYSHRSSAEAHSVRLRIGVGVEETIWLKGKEEDWDGLEYRRATATSETEAAAGEFTNYALFENLQAESINLNASYGLTAIQIVKSTDLTDYDQ